MMLGRYEEAMAPSESLRLRDGKSRAQPQDPPLAGRGLSATFETQ